MSSCQVSMQVVNEQRFRIDAIRTATSETRTDLTFLQIYLLDSNTIFHLAKHFSHRGVQRNCIYLAVTLFLLRYQVSKVGGRSPRRDGPGSALLSRQNKFIRETVQNTLCADLPLSESFMKNLTNRLPVNVHWSSHQFQDNSIVSVHQFTKFCNRCSI